ncbi:hypothetical protein L1987_29641 [Smallanthus sonchifolius]|uniref:Uncharacterized protein n=1 Tax=Smallanthus sonchifolius TaxID=185202 RepID=A0ACB9I019_9ASTR|nr:hypothetical protein L1987_29641 [Smallanthus sonchifolius]
MQLRLKNKNSGRAKFHVEFHKKVDGNISCIHRDIIYVYNNLTPLFLELSNTVCLTWPENQPDTFTIAINSGVTGLLGSKESYHFLLLDL